MSGDLEIFIRNRLPSLSKSPAEMSNWFENHRVNQPTVICPVFKADIINVIKYAEQDHLNYKISVLGSKWSYTDCALNTNSDIYLDLEEMHFIYAVSHLRRIVGIIGFRPDLRGQIDFDNPISTSKLKYVQAGVKLYKLNCALDSSGLALHTLGGSSGQSLAGAINTGSHGGDYKRPPFANCVRAIHLITYGGQEWWIEPEYFRITNDSNWTNSQINRIYDDDFFDSVLLSFGCAGVIIGYVIETVDAFLIESGSFDSKWSTVKSSIADIARGLYEPVDFIEAIVLPGDYCRVTRRIKATRTSISDYPNRNNLTVDQTDPQSQIDQINRCWGFRIFDLRVGRDIIDGRVKDAVKQTRPDGRFLHKSWIINTFQPDCFQAPKDHSPTEKRIRSHEYVVHPRFVGEFVDALQNILVEQRKGSRAIVVTMNIRLTSSSRGILAPQQSWAAHVEIYMVEGVHGNSRFESALYSYIANFNRRSFGDNLGNVKIRPHWGQLHDPTIFNFDELYPKLPVWRSTIARLKNGSLKSTFDSQFALDRGLL